MRTFILLNLLALLSAAGFSQLAYADHSLPAHKLDCSVNFPCPPELRRRVDFWIEVFKGWSKEKAILHDPQVPERVYAVIDTGHGCSRKVSKRIKANRQAVSKSLKSLASNLANKREIVDKRERHLLTLFPSKSAKRIRRAAKDIRCQSGVRDSFIGGLKRFNQYSDLVDRVLVENNLPPEIRYLPFVESSYNPAAYSKAGAAGLWQIMPATARSLGLELNATVDERLDPEAATRAAAKYFLNATRSLGKLSRQKKPGITAPEINPFVITSYNYGVNGMRRAIQKISPDFMQVLNRYKSAGFQVAVKNFYASFLAARHVALNADRYFGSVVKARPVNYQTLVLKNATSLDRIKKVFGLTEAKLKPLNRPLTRFIWNGWRMIPAGYQLRLPKRQGQWKTELSQLATLAPEKIVPGTDRYKVRKGDTACGIARALRVNCSTLIKANRLGSRAVIRVGQKLVIPRKLVASSSNATTKVVASTTRAANQSNRNKTWVVKKGNTACAIARRLGVSCRELIRFNQLGRKARIYPGQRLKIPTGDYLVSNPAGLNSDNKYIVQKGDVACVIAARFSVGCNNLIRLNRLSRKATIYPGQKLIIPGYQAPETSVTASQLASMEPSDEKPLNALPAKRGQPERPPDNQLANLLDTLPDLSIRVGSEAGKPVYSIFVEVDETLGHFADWLGIKGSSALRKLNKLRSTTNLRLGQRIRFPEISPDRVARFEQMRVDYHQVLSENLKENYQLVGIESYTVKDGESLWEMSRSLGFPLWLLYRLNPELRLRGLAAGKSINLPQLKAI